MWRVCTTVKCSQIYSLNYSLIRHPAIRKSPTWPCSGSCHFGCLPLLFPTLCIISWLLPSTPTPTPLQSVFLLQFSRLAAFLANQSQNGPNLQSRSGASALWDCQPTAKVSLLGHCVKLVTWHVHQAVKCVMIRGKKRSNTFFQVIKQKNITTILDNKQHGNAGLCKVLISTDSIDLSLGRLTLKCDCFT